MRRQRTYVLILSLVVFPFASAEASKETEPPPTAPPPAAPAPPPVAPPAEPAPPAAAPAPPPAAPAPPPTEPSPPAAAPTPPPATPAAPPAAAPTPPPAAAPPPAPTAPATPALPAAPEPKKGRVRVTADGAAPGATVVIDGIGMGPLPWEGDMPVGPHTIDLLGGSVSAKPKSVDVTAAALMEVQLETVAFPAPVEAKPVLAPPPAPAPAATVATPSPLPPAPQAHPRIGVMLGVLSLPRPIQIEATLRPFDALSLSAQYSMLPDLTAPGGSASLQLRAYQGIVRCFPFSGSFFLGSGLGFQTFRASLTTEVQGGQLVTTADLSAPFVSPQIGWLFVWQSGFTLGVTLGVQLTLPREPTFPATYNGQPVPDMAGPGVPQEAIDRVEESRDEIRTLAKLATKYPLPNFDLLRIGFFF